MNKWFQCPRLKMKRCLEICRARGPCPHPEEWVYEGRCHWKSKKEKELEARNEQSSLLHRS